MLTPQAQDIEAARKLGQEIAELADSILSSEGDPNLYAKEIADLSAAVTGLLVSRLATARAEGERKGRELGLMATLPLPPLEDIRKAEQRGREEERKRCAAIAQNFTAHTGDYARDRIAALILEEPKS